MADHEGLPLSIEDILLLPEHSSPATTPFEETALYQKFLEVNRVRADVLENGKVVSWGEWRQIQKNYEVLASLKSYYDQVRRLVLDGGRAKP